MTFHSLGEESMMWVKCSYIW